MNLAASAQLTGDGLAVLVVYAVVGVFALVGLFVASRPRGL